MTDKFLRPLLGEYEARHQCADDLNLFLRNVLDSRGVVWDPTDAGLLTRITESTLIPHWVIAVHNVMPEDLESITSPHFKLFDPITISFSPEDDHPVFVDSAYNDEVGRIYVGSNAVVMDGSMLDSVAITALHSDLENLFRGKI